MDVTNGLETPVETLYGEIESFFQSAPPLKDSDNINQKLDQFLELNSSSAGKFT